jgi:uncharacterized protein YbcI
METLRKTSSRAFTVTQKTLQDEREHRLQVKQTRKLKQTQGLSQDAKSIMPDFSNEGTIDEMTLKSVLLLH